MPSLIAILGGDMSQLQAVFNKAPQEAAKAGQSIGSALSGGIQGALAGLGGAKLIKDTFAYAMEEGSKAKDIDFGAERLGVSIQRFQDLERDARRANTSIEAVYTAYRKLAVGSIEAEGGNAEMIASFRTLGVSMDDLKSKSPDQIFQQIVASMKGMNMEAPQIAALIKTMGRGADEMIPGLKRGLFEGTNPFAMTGQEVKAAEEFKGNIKVMGDAWDWLKRKVLSPGANEGGLINSFIKTQADSIRVLFNIKKDAGGAGSPTDLKAVAKGDVDAEKKADKDKEDTQKRILKLRQELAKEQAKTDLDAMSSSQKLEELQKRRSEIIRNMGKMDEEHRLIAAKDVEDIDQQRQGIAASMAKHGTKQTLDVNALQKIGGSYTSIHDVSMLDTSKKQEQHLKEIRDILKVQRGPSAHAGSTVRY